MFITSVYGVGVININIYYQNPPFPKVGTPRFAKWAHFCEQTL